MVIHVFTHNGRQGSMHITHFVNTVDDGTVVYNKWAATVLGDLRRTKGQTSLRICAD